MNEEAHVVDRQLHDVTYSQEKLELMNEPDIELVSLGHPMAYSLLNLWQGGKLSQAAYRPCCQLLHSLPAIEGDGHRWENQTNQLIPPILEVS